MGKPNKNKNAQSERGPTKAIEEPEFGVKSESKTLSAGEKKLLAQLERERKEQEEDRLRKEKLEADKKKKNNKASSSGKTKPKPGPPKNKEEEKKPVYEAPKPKPNENEANEARFQQETPKPKGTWNERVEKAERFQETIKSKIQNVGNEERFQKTPRQRITWDKSDENAARFQETPKSKTTREENEADDSWYQDNNPTSNVTSTEPDAWDRQGDNWRNKTRRGISEPNYSNNNYGNQNNFAGRSNYQYTYNDGKNDKEFQMFVNDRSNVNGKVREEIGDLFNAPNEYSLAHCVAEDFSMGAGIAKDFRRIFKSVSKLLDQGAKTGGLAVLEDKDRFIYYLVTKKFSRGKPSLYTLWMSLLELRNHITKHRVTKLAIPQIGCGLDRLDWSEVKRMLEYIFSKNEIDIVVYIFNLKRSRSNYPRHNMTYESPQNKLFYPPPAKKPKLDYFFNRSSNYNTYISDLETSDETNLHLSQSGKNTRNTRETQKSNPKKFSDYKRKTNKDQTKDSESEFHNKKDCTHSSRDRYKSDIYSKFRDDKHKNDPKSSYSDSEKSKEYYRNLKSDRELKFRGDKHKNVPKSSYSDSRKSEEYYPTFKSDNRESKFSDDKHKNYPKPSHTDSRKSNKNTHESTSSHLNDHTSNKSSLQGFEYNLTQNIEHNSTISSTQNIEHTLNNSDNKLEHGKYKKDKSKREKGKKHKEKKCKHSKNKKNKKHR